MPISQLAQCTESTNSTVSGIVDRLERMGLVKRVRSEQDRRVIYVALTESSRAMERAVEPDVNAQMSRMLTDLTAQELEKIRGALETLERVLDKEAQQE